MTQDNSVEHHPFLHPSSRRLHVMLLLMFGYFSMAIMTANIGITLNCMVNSTAVAIESGLELSSNESGHEIHITDYGGTYDWSIQTQGYIVGATFLGGMVATFPSGIAMDRYSVRHLLLVSVLVISTASLALPSCAEYLGANSVIFLRFLMGLGEGLMIPGLNSMITRWVPLHEKSMGASLYTAGNQLAGIIGNPVGASLCGSSLRWPSVFYLCGSLGIIWMVMWLFTVNNSPASSKWMSDKERAYLEHHMPKTINREDKKTPWKDIIRSPPFLVLIYCSVITNMMLAFLLVYIPFYFKDVLYLDVKKNGLFSAVPHLVNLTTKLVWGFLMDELKRRKVLTPTQACKLSQGLAMLVISISFASLGYFVDDTTPGLAITLLCSLCGGFGLCISGFLTSLLSVAPNYIGVLSSITQIIGFAGRVATPQLITFFKTTGSAEEWKGILMVFAFMTAISGVVFTIWGSGDVQPWNYSESPSVAKNLDLVDKKLLNIEAQEQEEKK